MAGEIGWFSRSRTERRKARANRLIRDEKNFLQGSRSTAQRVNGEICGLLKWNPGAFLLVWEVASREIGGDQMIRQQTRSTEESIPK